MLKSLLYKNLLIALNISLMVSGALVAQDNAFAPNLTQLPAADGSNQDFQATATAQIQDKTLQQVLNEIDKAESEINQLYSSIPIGFPEVQQRHMAKIKELREQSKLLKEQVEPAAMRSFSQNPQGSPEAAKIIFEIMSKKLDASKSGVDFDPKGALEIAKVMLKNAQSDNGQAMGIDINNMSYQAFRASFAVHDFDNADAMLSKIEASGLRLNSVIREKLVDAKNKWQQELMIRKLEANANDLPQVKIQTTDGDIVVELFENHAPQTVGNFISLVEKQYYDNLAFFLVRPGEFSQTGCRMNNGSSDAGYQIPCECDREEIRHHFAGTLSMVNKGKDTGGSQFFISHQPNRDYDGNYTVFGRVIEGMDIVYKLKRTDATLTGSVDDASKILKAEVLRKRSHPYGPTRIAKNPENKVGDATQSSPLRTAQGSGG